MVNRDGPVRAIRSYLGANSGPMTGREHIFYDRSEQVRTFLRVHSIPGVIDFFDYAPTPKPMTYRNSATDRDFQIDGSPDAVPETAPDWEQVTGPYGTLTQISSLQTTATGLGRTLYYLDTDTPNGGDELQCTGDGVARGASGTRVLGPIPNTDPLQSSSYDDFTSLRTIFYDGPGQSRAAAARRAGWVAEPLRVRGRAKPTRR